MFLHWPRRRSAGISVPWATYRLIRSGDRARNRQAWQQAAASYAAALRITPSLAHIWIQLGHAQKEAGAKEDARRSYVAAAEVKPLDAEPHIHLGHMAKATDPYRAAEHFLEALRRDPTNLVASGELLQLLAVSDPRATKLLAEAFAHLGLGAVEQGAPVPADHRLFFDISDLLAYFTRARLPTGIQRVQIEVALAIVAGSGDFPATLCTYSSLRSGWAAVPADRFRQICAASLESDDLNDPQWRRSLLATFATLATSDTIRFPSGATLVNLGTTWADKDYLPEVRRQKALNQMRYVPIVYDCIPILHPEWFISSLSHNYRAWMDELIVTASGYITISEATRRDLLAIAHSKVTMIPEGAVRVAPLDGDFRRIDRPTIFPEMLAQWGLHFGGFVLMVSTIEPRKNHRGAFEAWLSLAREIGEHQLPMLICVGGRGWLNDDVHAMIQQYPLLRRRVRLLSGISDAELDLLYRSCLFTLYPSFYEGWGLPVTESLCYGKIPAISCTSALPEAGGALAAYFDPHDKDEIVAVLKMLIVDEAARSRLEERISNEFRPRNWGDIAKAIIADVEAIAHLESRQHL